MDMVFLIYLFFLSFVGEFVFGSKFTSAKNPFSVLLGSVIWSLTFFVGTSLFATMFFYNQNYWYSWLTVNIVVFAGLNLAYYNLAEKKYGFYLGFKSFLQTVTLIVTYNLFAHR